MQKSKNEDRPVLEMLPLATITIALLVALGGTVSM